MHDDNDDVTLVKLHEIAAGMVGDCPDGESLAPLDAALIVLGVAASVTALDRTSIATALDRALAAGASEAQAVEVMSLVSGLGVHTLMASMAPIAERARARNSIDTGPLDDARQALWNRHVGDDPFWQGFERELPGFLEGMLRLSPDQFVAFFDYCAVPWRSGTVRARCKELIAMACDATPAHRFLPGFRLHLRNALALGAGKRAVIETLALAAAAPAHRGTR
jgi:alkylhydroperoxidase/carboxymuconolactone decarboxylase family protein YurZ